MKIKGIALCVGLGAVSFALPAGAADYSAGPAAYDWTGAYIGAQAGFGWSHTDAPPASFYEDPNDDPAGAGPAFSFNGDGFIGGAEAGYNWQTGSLVFGVVGDISAAGIKGTHVEASSFSADSTINWLSTARLNIGLPMGNALLYGTAGVAFGGVTSDLHDNYGGGSTVIHSSDSGTGVGWTAGAGLAVALGTNWVLKGEYLYVDLGSVDYSYSEPSGWPLITGSAKTTASLARLALDYRF